VAVILSAVLHFVPDDGQAAAVVDGYLDAAAPGSYLLISHHGRESDRPDEARAREIYSRAVQPLIPRSRDQVAALFRDTEIIEPGVVLTTRWRPGAGGPPPDEPYFGYAGLGRKA
jgi:hypothetical protein